MLLAIDIGNSHIAVGLNDGESWVHHWRIHTEANRTSDEYASVIYALVHQQHIRLDEVQQAVLSSVVPELVSTLKRAVQSLFGISAFLIDSTIITGLAEGTMPPEIGSDLLANAAAAHAQFPQQDCMVIDFGTALTFTTVSAQGRILGVAIAPGVGSAVEALSTKTAQLPHIDIQMPRSVLGLTTVSAIQAGVVFGYTGLISSLIEQTEIETGLRLTVIATGGFSQVIAPNMPRIDHLKPWHTLDGLKLLYEMNLS